MAIPTITKLQKTAQQMLDTYKKQQTASTAATQSGSTSTPAVSSTPKVTSTPKAQASVQQTSAPQQQIQAAQAVQQINPKDLLGASAPATLSKIRAKIGTTGTKVETPDLFSAKEEEQYQSHLQKWFNIEPGEKIKEVVTNLFDKLRPASQKIVETGKALKDYREVVKSETKEATKDFEKWYTPEGLKQYFNYYEDTLGETVRPMVGNLMYTSLDTLRGATNRISNSIESLNNYIPDQGLLVRKGILPASQTQEEIEEEKKRLQDNREAITASILETVYAGERWMDSTEIGKETKAIEGTSLLDALKKGDTDTVRGVIGSQIGYILPSVGAGIVGGDVGVAASIFPVMYQETLDDYMNDPSIVENNSEEKIHWMATASAGIQTAIEIISLETQILKPIRNTKLSNEISKKVTQPVVSRVIGQWLKGSIAEGVEEISQQWVEQKFAQLLGSNRALLTVDDYADIGLEAFIMGLIISGPGAVVEGVSTKRQTLIYNENIRKLREEIPGLTEDEAKEILNAVIDYEEKEEDAEKLEEKATKLYDNKQSITNQINQLRENPTQTSKYEIQLLENKLQDIDKAIANIDKKINSLYKPMEEATKKLNKGQPTQEEIQTNIEQNYKDMLQSGLSQIKDELLMQQTLQTQTQKQEGGRNLSEQTMQTVTQPEVEEISRQESPAPSESQQLYEYTEAKKIGTKNRVSVKDVNKILKLTGEKQRKEMSKYSLNALGGILNYVRQMMPDKYESIRANAESVLKDLADAKEKIRLFEEQYGKRYEPEKMLRQSEAEGKKGTKFVTNNMKADLEHLVGLKGVTIKDTDKKIDKKIADYLSLTLSEVMTGLGIDFNKVLKKYGLEFQLTTSTRTRIPGEGVDTRGIFVRNRSRLTGDIVRIGMGLLLNGRTEQEIKSTLRHELIHMLDGTSLTKGGAFEKYPNYRDFYTFKGHEKNSSYWNDPSEVIARYGQQYLADIFDKQEFEHLCNEDYFWSKEEFEKLKGLFEDFIGQFSDLELDDANKNYYGVMIMLNDYKQGKLSSDEKRLESIRDRYELGETEMSRDIEQKILSMEKEYAWITEQVESLEGDIKDEIKLGYEITLQEISTNLDMLATMKEKYIEATKNTKAQQENLNEMTNTISDNIDNAETSATDVEQGSEVISDTVTEPESEDNPTGVDTNAPLHEQVKQSVDITLKSVDKLVKNKKNKAIIHEIGQGFKNAFTPALSRLYSISPRLAGGVHRYQAMKELLTNSYKKATLDFVKAMDKLKKKNPEVYKKLSLALFDYGMVDTIEIKEELKKAGIDPKLFEPVAQVLNQIAKDYQAAGLDITVNDKYFPRKVKDYGLLLDYLSMKSGKNIEDTRTTLLKFIEDTNNDPTLSEGEKEKKIHSRLINEFSKPSEMSNNAKERKLVLSEWQLTEEEKAKGYKNDITDFYEEPIVALSMYIEDMVKKTELKKMLGGLTEQGTAISEDFDTSVAGILMEMQAKGELTKEQADEAAYVIKSIVNVKPSGKLVQAIKDATYNLTIANYLSAAQQLEDLAKTLLRGPSGFKNIVKSILGKAGIKMKDTGLNNLFDTVQKGGLTDWNFKLSGFDMVDSLGKVSFLNTAYDSCVKQANGRRAIILQHRLTAMYGEVKGMEIFEKYKEGKLKTDEGLLDLDLMVDLLYQLGSTQPIYQSAMPTAYLNNPGVRLMYCLYSFSIKQVDWVIQGTKEVYQNQLLMGNNKAGAATVAGLRCIRSLTVVALISALVGDLISTAKGDEEDTVRWNWINNGWKEGLKRLGINGFTGFLKIFNISRYDSYIFKREGLLGVLMSKLTPASVSIANDLINIAVGKEELSDLGRYGPLFLKPMYYIFKNNDMMPDYKLWEGSTGGSKSSKFGKTSVGTSGPVNTSKFGGYSVK